VRIACGLAELGCSPDAEWLEVVHACAQQVAAELEAGAAGQLAWAMEKLSSGSRQRQRSSSRSNGNMVVHCSLDSSEEAGSDHKKLNSNCHPSSTTGALTAAVQKQYRSVWSDTLGVVSVGADMAGRSTCHPQLVIGQGYRPLNTHPAAALSVNFSASSSRNKHSSQRPVYTLMC
jgi:hypothetical protein